MRFGLRGYSGLGWLLQLFASVPESCGLPLPNGAEDIGPIVAEK